MENKGIRYIAYYRVSSRSQGESGLGLEGQEASIKRFLRPTDEILFSFTEVESGTNDKRPELKKAIEACLQLNATLLVSTIDRLTRNLPFLLTLINTKDLQITAADMPNANRFMFVVMGMVAEYENERRSLRQKAAFQAKRQRGEKMGRIENLTGQPKGAVARHEGFLERMSPIKPLILHFLKEGKTDKEIIKKIPELCAKESCPRPFLDRCVKHLRKEYETSTLASQ